MQIQEVVHDKHCLCGECGQVVMHKFQAFEIVPRHSRLRNRVNSCPKCERPVTAEARGGFMLWVCWECNTQLAIVKKIINREDDNVFGFAEKEDGQQIYFHCGRYMEVTFDGNSYVYRHPMSSEVPELDDVIRYQEFVTDRGLKALWWTREDDYQNAKQLIDGRWTYRLIQRTGKIKISRLQEAPIMKVHWEGKDIPDLRKMFPKNHYSLYSDDSSGLTIQAFDHDKDAWYDCEDPR